MPEAQSRVSAQGVRTSARSHTRPREIADSLTRRILDGRYPPGTKLPTERELAAEFETNRNVVREALTRLEAVGLVRIRQGSGIYAEDVNLAVGVQIFDLAITREDGSVNLDFLRDVMEVRRILFCSIVRLAAQRRTEEEMAGIRRLAEERAKHKTDLERLTQANTALFRAIVNAAHNQILRYLFNTVGSINMRLWTMVDLPQLGFDERQGALQRIVEAIEMQDADLAALLVLRSVEAVEASLFTQD